MIVGKTCFKRICLSFVLHFFIRLEIVCSVENTTCNNGKFLCKPFGNCDFYASRMRLPIDLVWCDAANYIVCCPRATPQEDGPKYYKGIEKPFTKDCIKWHQELHEVCPPEKLIVGGKRAVAKEMPHMALLGIKTANEYKWLCGGSLINSRYVLTAAHCMEAENVPTHVRLGELDYNTTDDDALVQEFKIKDYISHPDYDLDTYYYDISIVELNGTVQFNSHVAPICLPASNGSENTVLRTAGWGATGTAQETSTYLQKVLLERFDETNCQAIIGMPDASEGVKPDLQICAGSYGDHRDTCQGDSGGPLFIEHPDLPCMYLIHGITSYGNACGLENIPGVYTRVYPYVEWIESVVWNNTLSR